MISSPRQSHIRSGSSTAPFENMNPSPASAEAAHPPQARSSDCRTRPHLPHLHKGSSQKGKHLLLPLPPPLPTISARDVLANNQLGATLFSIVDVVVFLLARFMNYFVMETWATRIRFAVLYHVQKQERWFGRPGGEWGESGGACWWARILGRCCIVLQ